MPNNSHLIYIANVRLPTEKAHGIQIMEMCAAFADEGKRVTLVVPRRFNPIKKSAFEYHDVRKNFSIKRLFVLDLTRFYRPGFIVETVTFVISVIVYSLFHRKALFYTRDEAVAVPLSLLGLNVIWEGHMGHNNGLIRTLIRRRVKMVVITEGLKDLYISLGARPEDILVAADGADLSRFDIPLSREDARKQLGLPQDKKIVLYKGSLQKWKGADTLAEAMKHIARRDALAVFIGGTEADVANFKTEFGHLENVLILGNRPRQETPVYQKAADILVIPNTAKEDISKLYTSPMKLFGYMAGDRPIVASDLPSLREVLSESLANFFVADDPQSLAQALDLAIDHYNEALEKAHRALDLAKEYSWQKRAEGILSFIHV